MVRPVEQLPRQAEIEASESADRLRPLGRRIALRNARIVEHRGIFIQTLVVIVGRVVARDRCDRGDLGEILGCGGVQGDAQVIRGTPQEESQSSGDQRASGHDDRFNARLKAVVTPSATGI